MDPETPSQEQNPISIKNETIDSVQEVEEEIKPEPPIVHQELDSLDLAALQLHQLNAAQAQALAEAAAAAISGTTPAAVNYQQLFANFDPNTAIAAAAAAVAAVNASSNHNNNSSSETTNTSSPTSVNMIQLPSAELIKRELMNQKVRADNRERKKRWRQQNEERNKDNDLRCRVNKRAHKLFGKEDSDHKRRWVEEEFSKRQQKRKEKERRRGLVDDSLGGRADHNNSISNHNINNNSNNNNSNNNINDGGLDLVALAQQLAAQQQQQQTSLTEANYLTLLCNNLGIPAAARTLLGNTNPVSSPPPPPQPQPQPQPQTQLNDELKQEKMQQQFPLQLLELLQQLQQYQQPQQQETASDQEQEAQSQQTLSSDFNLSGSTSSPGTSQDTAFTSNEDAKAEEKLAALLASTFQAVAAAAANSNNNHNEIKLETNNDNTEEQQQQQQQQQNINENNPQNAEFPMDAVLTLMQLNAGWRQ